MGWFAAALIFAILDWLSVYFQKLRWRWLTKTGAMLCLIAAYTYSGGWLVSFWFGTGLLFSLAGDIFLLLPPRFFMVGLISFLFTHFVYILALSDPPTPWQPIGFLTVAVLLVIVFFVFRQLSAALQSHPSGRRLKPAVLLYIVTISVMVYFALSTLWNPAWNFSAALLASLGALLFYLSDYTLARQRFIRSSRSGRALVMVTYHLAQFGMITGFLLRGHL
jgi:uncharacterized membrane protein YhhN